MGWFAWFWILYFSSGLFIMAEAIVTAWDTVEEKWWIKVIGSTLALVAWPLSFFV